MKKKKINEGLVDKLYQGLIKMVMSGKAKQAKEKAKSNKELQAAIERVDTANKMQKDVLQKYEDNAKKMGLR